MYNKDDSELIVKQFKQRSEERDKQNKETKTKVIYVSINIYLLPYEKQ